MRTLGLGAMVARTPGTTLALRAYPDMPLKIIVLEDDPVLADTIAGMLRELGHEVCGVARRAADLPKLLAQHTPDLVTIDVNLGQRREGVGVATVLEAAGVLPVVFVTPSADAQEQQQIRSIEGSSLLLKPFTREELAEAIQQALDRAREDRSPQLGP